MFSGAPGVYQQAKILRDECWQVANQTPDSLIDADEDGHLKAGSRIAGKLGGLMDHAAGLFGQENSRKVRIIPVKQQLSQMSRASIKVSQQADLRERTVELSESDIDSLTAAGLSTHLDKLMESRAWALVRMHEYLDEILGKIRNGDEITRQQELTNISHLIGNSFNLFSVRSGEARPADNFKHFSDSVNAWLQERWHDYEHWGQTETDALAAIHSKCHECLSNIEAEIKGVKSQRLAPPEPECPIKTVYDLDVACQVAAHSLHNLQQYDPQTNVQFNNIVWALQNLAQGEQLVEIIQRPRIWGLNRDLDRTLRALDPSHPLRRAAQPFMNEMQRVMADWQAFRNRPVAPANNLPDVMPEQHVDHQTLPSLQQFPSLRRAEPQRNLLGGAQPRRQQHNVHVDHTTGEKCIPVDDDKLTYDHLCNEPRFAEQDFVYLRNGDYRIYTRSNYGPSFKHDRVMEKGIQKWKLHLSINRNDMDRAFPIVKDWIMNPANRMFAAKVISQDNRESPDQMGKEFTLYLYEDPEYGNKDAAHWQQKLGELEKCLKNAGILPGPRPDPERHKCDRPLAGSRFFHYRNDSVRVEEHVDRSLYNEHQDRSTGLRYYSNKWLDEDIVVLQEDFNQVPVGQRYNLLPGSSDDFLANVHLGDQADEMAAATRPARASQPVISQHYVQADPADQLSGLQHEKLMNGLQKVRNVFPDMTTKRMLVMLQDPDTGSYPDLEGWLSIPSDAIISYLTLQSLDPQAFPDDEFHAAYHRLGVRCYFHDCIPQGNARQDWVNMSRELMEHGRTARQIMKEYENVFQYLMPDTGNFINYVSSKAPGKNIPGDIPAELLADYKKHICEEVFIYLKTFGPSGFGHDIIHRIFTDCCDHLLTHLEPEKAHESNEIYTNQRFGWLDKSKHCYKYKAAVGFVAYADPQADDAYIPPVGECKETANKFRISIHPHDYQKAWPLVAEILHRNNCPFPRWKSTWPNRRNVGQNHERLSMGGQFTLYSLDHPEGNQNQRFQEGNIARCLTEIESALRNHNIRPGQQPHTDVYFGEHHPFISYRFDMDKNREYYQPAQTITHQRRREYMEEPRYKGVKTLIVPEA